MLGIAELEDVKGLVGFMRWLPTQELPTSNQPMPHVLKLPRAQSSATKIELTIHPTTVNDPCITELSDTHINEKTGFGPAGDQM